MLVAAENKRQACALTAALATIAEQGPLDGTPLPSSAFLMSPYADLTLSGETILEN